MAGFVLLEALLWEPDTGFFLLERHLARLAASATHFGFACDPARVRARLVELPRPLPPRARRVRVELSSDGSLFVEHVAPKPSHTVRLPLARAAVDSGDEFLRHKTSRRDVYEQALRDR